VVPIGLCRCLPDSSAPPPPDRNRWPRAALARGETTIAIDRAGFGHDGPVAYRRRRPRCHHRAPKQKAKTESRPPDSPHQRLPPAPRDKERDPANLKFPSKHTPETSPRIGGAGGQPQRRRSSAAWLARRGRPAAANAKTKTTPKRKHGLDSAPASRAREAGKNALRVHHHAAASRSRRSWTPKLGQRRPRAIAIKNDSAGAVQSAHRIRRAARRPPANG
jgi:hypothetical protein